MSSFLNSLIDKLLFSEHQLSFQLNIFKELLLLPNQSLQLLLRLLQFIQLLLNPLLLYLPLDLQILRDHLILYHSDRLHPLRRLPLHLILLHQNLLLHVPDLPQSLHRLQLHLLPQLQHPHLALRIHLHHVLILHLLLLLLRLLQQLQPVLPHLILSPPLRPHLLLPRQPLPLHQIKLLSDILRPVLLILQIHQLHHPLISMRLQQLNLLLLRHRCRREPYLRCLLIQLLLQGQELLVAHHIVELQVLDQRVLHLLDPVKPLVSDLLVMHHLLLEGCHPLLV